MQNKLIQVAVLLLAAAGMSAFPVGIGNDPKRSTTTSNSV